MNRHVVEFTSLPVATTNFLIGRVEVEIITKDGLTCTIEQEKMRRDYSVHVKIEWDESEIGEFGGQITYGNQTRHLEIVKSGDWIDFQFEQPPELQSGVTFHFDLVPELREQLKKTFELSEHTNAVLEVGGRKLHVNRACLSFHSTYFKELFDDPEANLFRISGINYKDFAQMLSIVSPNPVFADDESAPVLLELAAQFQMPAVKRHVEHHLLNISDFRNLKTFSTAQMLLELSENFDVPSLTELLENRLLTSKLSTFEKIYLADRMKLDEDLENLIGGFEVNKETENMMKNSGIIEKLSDKTRLAIYDKLFRL